MIGLLIALMFSFTPAGWTFRYNPVSGTFLVQSKCDAWLFAVEVLRTFVSMGYWPRKYSTVATAAIDGHCHRAECTCDAAALHLLAEP